MARAMGGGIAPFVLVGGLFLMNFLASGLLMGWAGFLLMLTGEGAFNQLCEDGQTSCRKGDVQLNLVFTVGYTALGLSTLPCGILVDRMSARISVPLSMMCSVIAFGLLALSSSGNEGWRWFLLFPFVLLIATSQIPQLSSFQFVETLPKKWRGIGAGLLSGSFGLSSLVPVLLHQVWHELGGKGALPGVALTFAGILLLLTIFSLRLPPYGPRDRESTCAFSIRNGFYLIPLEADEVIAPEIESTSVRSHLCSIEFLALVVFGVSRAHFFTFYLSAANLHLQRINSAEAEGYVSMFSWIAPTGILGGLFGGPWVEHRSNSGSRGFLEAGVAIVGAQLVMCCFAWTEVLEFQPPVFVLYTQFQEVFFAALAVHLGRRFGYKHFGTLYGVFFFCLGLASASINPIVASATSSSEGFRTTFSVFAIGSVVSLFALLLMSRSEKRVKELRDKSCEIQSPTSEAENMKTESDVTVKSDGPVEVLAS
eukprot:TRINITY_DN16503_c0_g1_i6.p1 TRINITY_DN16503_c0_g1~~TRINITY_DN16503_c0_g1_i6.p1  ORF type:complete len:506 (+),score=51.75 TRINITY_DN16503_c0_g1_i6:74-1519(+)